MLNYDWHEVGSKSNSNVIGQSVSTLPSIAIEIGSVVISDISIVAQLLTFFSGTEYSIWTKLSWSENAWRFFQTSRTHLHERFRQIFLIVSEL